MSLNTTPRAERPHIAIFGRRNSGKSALINAITNQSLAIVSDVKGTTTDPVYKSMEILPLGPVVLIDTAGLDDDGLLGEQRVAKTLQVLDKTDIAVLVIDAEVGLVDDDIDILNQLINRRLKPLIVFNKCDLAESKEQDLARLQHHYDCTILNVSSLTGQGIDDLKEALARMDKHVDHQPTIVGDMISAGDVVVLVTPIDSAAPKGRLILPQQQVLRDVLDHDGMAFVCKETELAQTLATLKEAPRLVVTDSQAFDYVKDIVPDDVLLTGFSVLFARYKGDLETLVRGAKAIRDLAEGANILVAEGCTHHRQADDIGTVKIPKWLRGLTGKTLNFTHTSGSGYPNDFSNYDLIVHCGACMLNRKAVLSRLEQAREHGVPIVNYGVMIAFVNNMLNRALQPFPAVEKIWLSE